MVSFVSPDGVRNDDGTPALGGSPGHGHGHGTGPGGGKSLGTSPAPLEGNAANLVVESSNTGSSSPVKETMIRNIVPMRRERSNSRSERNLAILNTSESSQAGKVDLYRSS